MGGWGRENALRLALRLFANDGGSDCRGMVCHIRRETSRFVNSASSLGDVADMAGHVWTDGIGKPLLCGPVRANWNKTMNWTLALPLLLAAFGFGIAHAFEPDHMAAVSTFVAGRPKPREAALFGVRWAIGHGLSLFLIGSLLFLLRRAAEKSQPQLFASGVLDRFVGLILVGLGIWTLFQVVSSRASKTHAHGHFHDGEFHSHDGGAGHSHGVKGHSHPGGLASLGMGVMHGAAGTGAFIGQAAVSLSTSYVFVFLYTLLFSVGVLLSMGTYAGALGGLITTFEKRGEQALGIARIITAVLTCAIGVCLLSGIELPGLLDHFVRQP